MALVNPNPDKKTVAISSFFSSFIKGRTQRLMEQTQQQQKANDPREETKRKLAESILEDTDSPQERLDWASSYLGIQNYPKNGKKDVLGFDPGLFSKLPKTVQEDIAYDKGIYTPDNRKQNAEIDLTKQKTRTAKAQEEAYKALAGRRKTQYQDKDINWLKLQAQLTQNQLKTLVDDNGEPIDQDMFDEKTMELELIKEAINKKTGAIPEKGPDLREQANTILEELEKKYPTYSQQGILNEFYKTDVGKKFQQQGMK